MNTIYIPLWVALITIAPSIVGAILGYLNKRHLEKVASKMAALEENTNSKMDKLLDAKDELRKATNKASFIAGKTSSEMKET